MKRIVALDYYRVVLSFVVITLHMQPLLTDDSLFGWLISNGIARIAVPSFFIISGYFISSKIADNKSLKKHLLHILFVYLIWSFIYIPSYIDRIELRSLITFFFLGYYHLWFLPALITGILLLKGCSFYIKNNYVLLSIGIILFITGFLLETFDLPYRLFCNGIFFGYPFIVIGYFIRQEKVQERLRNFYLYTFILAGLILLIYQSYLDFEIEKYRNLSVALLIICPALFGLIIKNSLQKPAKNYIAKLASSIYYIHILVITTFFPLKEEYNISIYPLILGISVIFSIFIILINRRINILL